MRRAGLLLGLLLATLLATPAGAVLVPSHDFSGEIQAIAAGNDAKGVEPELALLTGSLEVTGRERGLLTVAGTRSARIIEVDRLEAYDTGGKLPSDVSRFPTSGRRAPKFFNDVNLTISDGSTVVLHTGATFYDVNVSSAFSLVVPLLPPKQVGNAELDLPENASLAIVGPASIDATAAGRADAMLAFTTNRTVLQVWRGDRLLENLTGPDWVYRAIGRLSFSGEGEALFVPLSHNATATMRPGAAPLASARLDLARLGEAYRAALPNANGSIPSLDQEVSAQVRQAAPIFNGVILGNLKGNATVGGAPKGLGPFTLLRFDELTLRAGEESRTVAYEGHGPFLLAGSSLHTAKAAAGPPSFPFPLLSLALWLLAVGALVLGRVVKPVLDPRPSFAARPIRLAAFVFHLVMIPVGFLLWDAETAAFLGTSILNVFGSGASGVALTAVIAIQGITFTLAWLYFGLPVRFLVNTCFRLASMHRARGMGKGISYLTAWGLGAAHYAMILNPFIGLFVESIGGVK